MEVGSPEEIYIWALDRDIARQAAEMREPDPEDDNPPWDDEEDPEDEATQDDYGEESWP